MNLQAALKRFAQDLSMDLRAYQQLARMLDEQFEAALRMDSAGLEAIGAAITQTVDTLNKRRDLRSALPVAPLQLIDACAEPQRAMLRTRWHELEALVNHCKALNLRNGRLITSQSEILQRVLHGENLTYAPA